MGEEMEPSRGEGVQRRSFEESQGYRMGYAQGFRDATENLPKMMAALMNPPPILVDAASIDPKLLAALMARSAPASSQGPNPLPNSTPTPNGGPNG